MSRLTLCLVLLLGPAGIALGANEPGGDEFRALLAEVGLDFDRPDGLSEVAPRANGLLPYEYALRADDAAYELRYAIRPLARMRIEYQDPHNAAPEPDHLFPLMFGALYGRLSVGGHVPTREYPPARARELFGADWAAAAVFDVDPEFARGYRQGLLLALHGARRGDAYVVFLFDDYAEVRDRIQADLARLRFSPEADADSG